MATRKTKTKTDKPLTWNPERITPVITASGVAIGSAWEPSPRRDMTVEELWIQRLLLKPGQAIPRNDLHDQLLRLGALLIVVFLLYIRARYW